MSEPAFVGTIQGVDIKTLKATIQRCFGSSGWQFLRWPHDIELLSTGKAHREFDTCQEGQAFNQICELRWKRKKNGYELLLLSSDEKGDEAFTKDKQSWKSQPLNAEPYESKETRLPKSIKVPKSFDLKKLGQRYFINEKTACVQFVSLRVK